SHFLHGSPHLSDRHSFPTRRSSDLDAEFRRALVHAIDRQQLSDALGLGYSSVAHSIIAPDQAQYRFVESSIVRYEYDPRRATLLDRKSTRLNSSHHVISYAVFCLKK